MCDRKKYATYNIYMALDISNVFYLAFRLGPFLVVSNFLFQSVLNWELRGIIYLCGLLLAALLAYLCNGPVNTLFPADVSHIFAPNAKCNVISLGENGRLLSQIPLSVCVYAYTYCDRPRTVTVEQGPKREKWWDGCGALVSLDSKLRKN
jgi:hypothetical protein